MEFSLVDKNGNEASQAMAKIIEARTKELGETTVNVCKAIAINIIKGVRADTKIANEDTFDITITNVDSVYTPSWSVEKGSVGKKKAQRVLRGGEGGAVKVKSKLKKNDTDNFIDEHYVIWKCPKYVAGESIHVFEIVDKVCDDKEVKFFVVCQDEKTAKETAEKIHRKRVHSHKGFARYVLGMAMHEISEKEKSDVKLNADLAIADSAKETYVSESGYDSGVAKVYMHDKLGYATKALKHGEQYVQIAQQKALNKMTGYINHSMHKKGIYDDLKIPYPELQKKNEIK